jgi:hypothetical protein
MVVGEDSGGEWQTRPPRTDRLVQALGINRVPLSTNTSDSPQSIAVALETPLK